MVEIRIARGELGRFINDKLEHSIMKPDGTENINEFAFPNGTLFLQSVDKNELLVSLGNGKLGKIPMETVDLIEYLKSSKDAISQKVVNKLESQETFEPKLFQGTFEFSNTKVIEFPTALNKGYNGGELEPGDFWIYKGRDIIVTKYVKSINIKIINSPEVIEEGDILLYVGCGKWIVQAENDRMVYSST